jgi:hypothetical protein
MAGLRPPRVPDRPVLVFDGDDLARRERARRSFQQRRNAAVITVFRATGIRLPALAGIRYDLGNPPRSDIEQRAVRRARSRLVTTLPAP